MPPPSDEKHNDPRLAKAREAREARIRESEKLKRKAEQQRAKQAEKADKLAKKTQDRMGRDRERIEHKGLAMQERARAFALREQARADAFRAREAARAAALIERENARADALRERLSAQADGLRETVMARVHEAATRGKPKDEARTLALLWRGEERASRSGLTVEAIIEAAIRVADEEGFEAVSMRRIADALEVGTMSLYTHVPGKAELADLMADAVHGELYSDVDEAKNQPGDYRDGIRFIAGRYKTLYERHPWLLDIPLARPALGPNACKKFEAELRVLEGIGLTDLQMDSVVSMIVMHVGSTSRMRIADRRAEQASGLSEVEWWMATVPMLHHVFTGNFPLSARVGPAAGQAIQPKTSAEHLYEFGLELLCESVTTMIERNRR